MFREELVLISQRERRSFLLCHLMSSENGTLVNVGERQLYKMLTYQISFNADQEKRFSGMRKKRLTIILTIFTVSSLKKTAIALL